MAKQFSESAQAVLNFLKERIGENITSQEIANALGLAQRSVTGVLTGLQRKGFIVREEDIQDNKKVKYIRLTSEGMSVDPNMEKPVE